jgi:hypothetical protein
MSGESHREPTIPQYLVYPIIWDHAELSAIGSHIKACLTDFTESFDVLLDPSSELSILPHTYCSPEYVLDNSVGIISDSGYLTALTMA